MLSAYQDGEIQILYKGRRSYSLSVPGSESDDRGHGDWLVDEIRLSESGMVMHEVVFSRGRWLIECADIEWRWRPIVQAPAGRDRLQWRCGTSFEYGAYTVIAGMEMTKVTVELPADLLERAEVDGGGHHRNDPAWSRAGRFGARAT